jgi:hypothetical protein
MALIKCPECGREISSKAPTCPGCGSPVGSDARPLGGIERGVTTRPDFWHDPNVGCIGVAVFLLLLIFLWVGGTATIFYTQLPRFSY